MTAPVYGEVRALYVAAKAPRPGLAKTRLAMGLGDERALLLYRGFLQDLAVNLPGDGFDLGWYVTPADAWLELGLLVDQRLDAPRVLAQPPGTWTDRQRWLFRTMAERGEGRTVLVASDSPQLTRGTVDQAFASLEDHDVVLGPTFDGGYYLIGMRAWRDVLGSVPMSTDRVLRDIMALAKLRGVSLALLEPTFDVDSEEDLPQLFRVAGDRDDLSFTRAALAELGAVAVS